MENKAVRRSSHFLTAPEREIVMRAIEQAEHQTSGEIRVHIERAAGPDVLARAESMFNRLGMFRTSARNGVLIYVAAGERRFAIIGDKGIHEAVPDGFWDETRDAMAEHFRSGDFCGGICRGIAIAGEALARYFPYQGERDVNELSDEISEGQ